MSEDIGYELWKKGQNAKPVKMRRDGKGLITSDGKYRITRSWFMGERVYHLTGHTRESIGFVYQREARQAIAGLYATTESR